MLDSRRKDSSCSSSANVGFCEPKSFKDLPKSSHQPGMVSVDLNKVLPPFIANALRKAFKDFEKKMEGYLTNDAVLMAPDAKTLDLLLFQAILNAFRIVKFPCLFPQEEEA